jgi:hypothetical protein
MPRLRTQQVSFTGGEIDPLLAARVDVSKYYSAARAMRNVVLLPMGGFRDRGGLVSVLEVSDWAAGGRLIPFAFNTEQTYLIAATNAQFRVLRNEALATTVTGRPWNAAQAKRLNWTQSADTLLLFHQDLAPYRIKRGADDVTWVCDVPTLANLPTHDFGSSAEAAISATRGWPRCGTIHQGRLILGGLRSRPSTMLGSKVGQYFDFNKGTALDDEGLNVTIDGDQVNAILQIVSGRHLQLFTSGGAFVALNAPPLTPKNFALDRQTKRAIKEFVRTAEIDGVELYVEKTGRSLREFVFTDVEQAYNADLSSLLAPHLIRDPVAVAVAPGTSEAGADYVFVVNADGTAACLNTLRSQEIAGYTLFETDGKFLDVAVLESGQIYFAVERTIGGVARYFIERLDRNARVDGAKIYASGFPISTATGLGHLEGKIVRAIRDGFVEQPKTVTGGQIALDRPAETALQVGLHFDAYVDLLPVEGKLADGTMIGRKARTVAATLRIDKTAALSVDGFVQSFRRFAVSGAASPLDAMPPEFTGDLRVAGLTGWSGRAGLRIARPFPAPMTVLGVSLEVSV